MVDNAPQHYLNLIQRLNAELRWGLSSATLARYSERVAQIWPPPAPLSDNQMRTIIVNYHLDHRVVEALRDRADPEHERCWAMWIEHATHILVGRFANIREASAATMSEQDLSQEAMHDLWHALQSFRYESRFQTWAFTVISNCYIRVYRSARAQKRRATHGVISLDSLPSQAEVIEDSAGHTPEDEAVGTALADLISQILVQHPDGRLHRIFELWAHGDQPLRSIGEQLHLSIPRVHALLNQALALLRQEDRLRTWDDADSV
ncbi:MAG: sigma-70 family RNA polymerase sigma factor [Chloroflexota bacterium]